MEEHLGSTEKIEEKIIGEDSLNSPTPKITKRNEDYQNPEEEKPESDEDSEIKEGNKNKDDQEEEPKKFESIETSKKATEEKQQKSPEEKQETEKKEVTEENLEENQEDNQRENQESNANKKEVKQDSEVNQNHRISPFEEKQEKDQEGKEPSIPFKKFLCFKIKKKKKEKKEKIPFIIFHYFLIIFCEYLNSFVTNSYISSMILDIGLVSSKSDVGLYTGLSTTVYFFGSFCGSLLFGKLSDTYGRRNMYLLGSFISVFASFCIIFMNTLSPFFFIFFIFFRFLQGFNANIGILKTVLSEAVPPSRTVEVFRLIGTLAGLAIIIINFFAGPTSRPTFQFPWLFDNPSRNIVVDYLYRFFNIFPYFIPSFASFFVYFCCWIYCFFGMQETNLQYIKKKGIEDPLNRISKKGKKGKEGERGGSIELETIVIEEEQTQQPNELQKSDDQEENISPSSSAKEEGEDKPSSLEIEQEQKKNEKEKIEEKKEKGKKMKFSWSKFNVEIRIPFFAIGCYVFMGLISFLGSTGVNVWLYFPIEKGGLNFGNWEIGIVEVVGGVAIFVSQFVFVPFIIKIIGIRWALRLAPIFPLLTTAFLPELSFLLGSDSIVLKVLCWIILIVVHFLRNVLNQLLFTASIVSVNNSTTIENSATINAISQTCVAVTRSLTPYIGNLLLSISTNIGVFPFDVHFIFILCSISYFLFILWSLGLPKTIEKRRIK